MASSPEQYTHKHGGAVPSFESLMDISIPTMEEEFVNINTHPAVQLGSRFLELKIQPNGLLTMLLPGVEAEDHSRMLIGGYPTPAEYADHLLKRVIITHEAKHGEIIAHDWLVDLTVGACCVVEGECLDPHSMSTESGPSISVDRTLGAITLSEGRVYRREFDEFAPQAMLPDPEEITGFLTDTQPFIGGCVLLLNAEDPRDYRHIFAT